MIQVISLVSSSSWNLNSSSDSLNYTKRAEARERKGLHHQRISVVQFVPPATRFCSPGCCLPSPTDVLTALRVGSTWRKLQREEGVIFLSHCTNNSSSPGLGSTDLERMTTSEACVGVEGDILTLRKYFFSGVLFPSQQSESTLSFHFPNCLCLH